MTKNGVQGIVDAVFVDGAGSIRKLTMGGDGIEPPTPCV
jgi:hypothetical protein